jgi:maltose O-acetyltransferase
MGDFAFRALSSISASGLVPAKLRTHFLRALGIKIHPTACVWSGADLRSPKLTMGPHSFLNVRFYHDGYEHLYIEENARIGPDVAVVTATHEIGPPERRCPWEVVGKPVHIKAGAWVASRVTILPGVTVERGCVIAAGSVVTKSTRPNGLYAGNPARRVCDLDVD